MLDGEHEERRTPQRVRPGREDRDLLARFLDREGDLGALGAPDPVPLHRQDPLGPIDELLGVVEQSLRVVRDPEEPLRQVATLHRRAAPFAGALDHLLVREHGGVLRAPVDRRLLPIGEALLEETKEQPLGPPVVLGIGGVQPTRPVERHAHPLERRGLLLDVGVGPGAGRDAALDRGVLGGQPERVPPDRVQHVVAAHRAVAGHGVATAEGLRMPHVEVSAGVREHVEREEPRSGVGGVIDGLVEALVVPARHPHGFDGGGVIPTGHDAASYRTVGAPSVAYTPTPCAPRRTSVSRS